MKHPTILFLFGILLGAMLAFGIAVALWPQEEQFSPIVEHSEITKQTLDTLK